MEFFNSLGIPMCFCEDILDIPADIWHREIDEIGISEKRVLEILLK